MKDTTDVTQKKASVNGAKAVLEKSRLRRNLGLLGATPDIIAERLLKASAYGYKNSTLVCPIGAFLTIRGHKLPMVCNDTVYTEASFISGFKLPPVIQEYVRLFDAGKFPQNIVKAGGTKL